LDSQKPVYHKMDLDKFDEILFKSEQQLAASRHALTYYFAERPEHLEIIVLVCDVLSINHRLVREMTKIKEVTKIEENKIWVSENEIILLESAVLAKAYTLIELKKLGYVTVSTH
jgi:hypothetical protein